MSWLYVFFPFLFAAIWYQKTDSERKTAGVRGHCWFYLKTPLKTARTTFIDLTVGKPASPAFISMLAHRLILRLTGGTSAIDSCCLAEPPGLGLCRSAWLPDTLCQRLASLKATVEMPKSAPRAWLLILLLLI